MTKNSAILPDELLKIYDYSLMSKEVRKIFNTVNLFCFILLLLLANSEFVGKIWMFFSLNK